MCVTSQGNARCINTYFWGCFPLHQLINVMLFCKHEQELRQAFDQKIRVFFGRLFHKICLFRYTIPHQYSARPSSQVHVFSCKCRKQNRFAISLISGTFHSHALFTVLFLLPFSEIWCTHILWQVKYNIRLPSLVFDEFGFWRMCGRRCTQF